MSVADTRSAFSKHLFSPALFPIATLASPVVRAAKALLPTATLNSPPAISPVAPAVPPAVPPVASAALLADSYTHLTLPPKA